MTKIFRRSSKHFRALQTPKHSICQKNGQKYSQNCENKNMLRTFYGLKLKRLSISKVFKKFGSSYKKTCLRCRHENNGVLRKQTLEYLFNYTIYVIDGILVSLMNYIYFLHI
eukprot:TCONS_00039421-protein